jgi:hypothetical protein
MAQQHKGTKFDRYPGMFRTASDRAAQTFGPPARGSDFRILSFGCSTGEEMRSLRVYFPDAQIFGCDLDLTLSAGRNDLPGEVFLSTPEAIAARGPYQLIFANSVLCRHPLPAGAELSDVFPFSEFEALATMLHDNLMLGGILCVYNTSYFFRDLAIADSYRPVRSHLIVENGFIPSYSKDGRLVVAARRHQIPARLRLDRTLTKPHDVVDCIFERSEGPPIYLYDGKIRAEGMRYTAIFKAKLARRWHQLKPKSRQRRVRR